MGALPRKQTSAGAAKAAALYIAEPSNHKGCGATKGKGILVLPGFLLCGAGRWRHLANN